MSENIQKEIGRWQRVTVRGMNDRQGAAAVQGPHHLHLFHPDPSEDPVVSSCTSLWTVF